MIRLPKLQPKNLLLDLLYDVAGSLVFGLGLYTFAREGGFATGGFSGLGLMLNHLTGLPIGTLTFLLNIPLIILSYRTLGRWFLLRTLKTMIIQTLILDLVMPLFPVYSGNPLIAALFTGVLVGAGLAIIYMRGSSTGGSDFLILSLHKILPHMSVGQFSLMIDCVILLLGAAVYGNIDAVLYGLISTFACSQVMDRVLYGAGSGKMAIIITGDGMETARRLRSADAGLQLVFVTGYADHVFDGYSVGALGYLMKPPKKEQLAQVLERAQAALVRDLDRAYICRSGDTHYRVPIAKILYFSSDRRQVQCVTQDRTYTFYGKLDAVAEEVGAAFVRVHQRYLVRAGAVDRLEGGEVVLRTGERLPVSRSCQQAALLALTRAELEG